MVALPVVYRVMSESESVEDQLVTVAEFPSLSICAAGGMLEEEN